MTRNEKEKEEEKKKKKKIMMIIIIMIMITIIRTNYMTRCAGVQHANRKVKFRVISLS
jgi:flagellar basal body-associated protein FliL